MRPASPPVVQVPVLRIKPTSAEAAIAKAIVAVHRSAKVGVGGALGIFHRTKLHAHHRRFETGAIRIDRQHLFIHTMLQRIAVYIASDTTRGAIPGFR